jgi:hypothetical protein
MSRIAITLLLALGACAAQADGTELGGVVSYTTTAGDAVKAANAHCQKYGRTARPTQTDHWGGSLTFSCERS